MQTALPIVDAESLRSSLASGIRRKRITDVILADYSQRYFKSQLNFELRDDRLSSLITQMGRYLIQGRKDYDYPNVSGRRAYQNLDVSFRIIREGEGRGGREPATTIGKIGWRYEAARKQRVVQYRANIGDLGLIRKLRRTYRGLQSIIRREGFITLHILNGAAA